MTAHVSRPGCLRVQGKKTGSPTVLTSQPPTRKGKLSQSIPTDPLLATSLRPSSAQSLGEWWVLAHQADMSIWQVLEDIHTSSTRRNWK